MIKRANELQKEERCVRGGPGNFVVTPLADVEDLRNLAKEMSLSVVRPGCGSGYHTHDKNCEIYIILEGELEYNDDGVITTIKTGDVAVTKDGHGHCVLNKTDIPCVLISLII
jgi:mannose-6-phosphate isomerase-like protein (cupin superfamily)